MSDSSEKQRWRLWFGASVAACLERDVRSLLVLWVVLLQMAIGMVLTRELGLKALMN